MGARRWFVALVVLSAGGMLLVAGVLGILGGRMSSTVGGGSPACVPSSSGPVAARGVGGLTSAQLANAGAVVAEGRRRGVPVRGIVVALAVASQESGFKNYANDGRGSDLLSFQRGVSRSLSLPHEAVGTDNGSVGIFQQQWPWWGTLPELMDPATAAGKFYAALVRVRGWQSMPVSVAGQAVQRSAYPDAYADDEALARTLLGSPVEATPVAGSGRVLEATPAACRESVATGPVQFPLPGSAVVRDARNFGDSASRWARGHTGTDLSTPCGTPVLAATRGTVVIRTDQAWAGPQLVQVSTGIGQLTTWYAHMRSVAVSDGQQVEAGQPLGEVGSEGNSTGCHLHFEVHPRGGSIYEDSVDPSSWLDQYAGQAPREPAIVPAGSTGSTRSTGATGSTGSTGSGETAFTLATFNVLGASHTSARGKRPAMASGPARMRVTVRLLDEYGVDVVGLQEFQRPQYRTLLRLAGDRYAFWSDPRDTENGIAWRRDRFTLVGASTIKIPYFGGRPRRMPVLRLRDADTGITSTFVNVHNPADTRRFPRQGRWRRLAVSRQIALVRRLAASGPTYVTGDMNDRRSVFCRYTATGLLRAANGGSSSRDGGACRLPRKPQIDWIFGPPSATFSHYTLERTPRVRWASDHPFVVTRVTPP